MTNNRGRAASDLRYKEKSLLPHVAKMGVHTVLDNLLKPRATGPGDVPYCIEAITKEWLTSAICSEAGESEVIGFEHSGKSSGSTVRGRIRLKYKGGSGNLDLPETVFAKSSPRFFNRVSLAMTDTMKTEAMFYRAIRPQLTIEAPRGYHCDYDLERGRSIQLMEDLATTKNATFCTPTSLIDRRKAEEIVRLLATFHGQFYGRAGLSRDYPWLLTYRQWFDGGFERFKLKKYHDQALAKIADRLPVDVRARADEIWTAKIATLSDHENLTQTILHGDVHLGNWYITGAGEMGLCDWQCLAIGSFAQDLAYAITTTLRVEDRRAWEKDLIGIYVDTFNKHALKKLTVDECWHLYRRHGTAGLVMWTVTLVHSPLMPDMQPEATAREMLLRTSTAMSDLKTLDLYK